MLPVYAAISVLGSPFEDNGATLPDLTNVLPPLAVDIMRGLDHMVVNH